MIRVGTCIVLSYALLFAGQGRSERKGGQRFVHAAVVASTGDKCNDVAAGLAFQLISKACNASKKKAAT